MPMTDWRPGCYSDVRNKSERQVNKYPKVNNKYNPYFFFSNEISLILWVLGVKNISSFFLCVFSIIS